LLAVVAFETRKDPIIGGVHSLYDGSVLLAGMDQSVSVVRREQG